MSGQPSARTRALPSHGAGGWSLPAPPGQPTPSPAAARSSGRRLAVASLVLGILALPGAIVGVRFSFLFAVAAVVVGAIVLFSGGDWRRVEMAMAGLILGLLTFVVYAAFLP